MGLASQPLDPPASAGLCSKRQAYGQMDGVGGLVSHGAEEGSRSIRRKLLGFCDQAVNIYSYGSGCLDSG